VVGWKGADGVTKLLGYKASAFTVECELPGEAIRIRADRLKQQFNQSPLLQTILS
jgi:hypothetical protein